MKTNQPPLVIRFGLGLLGVLGISLGVFYLMMHPKPNDLTLMAIFLGITATISGVAGYLASKLGWLDRTPSLRFALLGAYALASLLTFINVWVTARLMFTSQHDLLLASVLLVFAGGIAVLLGYFLSNDITHRLESLEHAAQKLAGGDMAARTAVEGRDEIASLAASFNEMAGKLEEANAQQRELENLRRELVAWATHDLQTPLTSIRVQIEALADGVVDDPETVRRYLRTTQRQVKDLSALIDDLFQVAQLDAGGLVITPTLCSFSDLLSDTLESFTALAAEKQIDLSGSANPGLDPVRLDAPRTGRLLNNLVSNALRYTPAGGKVMISAWREAAWLHVAVADTGDGINASDLPHIFERFYRGEKSRSRETGGAGLGLAIARGIVVAHGGSINVESQPGNGTTFHVRLPV